MRVSLRVHGHISIRKIGIFTIREEGCAALLGLKMTGVANLGGLPPGRLAPWIEGRGLWRYGAALGECIEVCFGGAVLFSLRWRGGTAILEENDSF